MALTWTWHSFFGRDRAVFAWAVTLIAAAGFLATMPTDAVPGDSARLIAQHHGIDPFTPLSHALWGWTGQVFAWIIPVGSLAFRWNLLSVICGAASCGLLCLLTTRLIGNRRDQYLLLGYQKAAQNIAGVSAALLLAFCQPFRLVSSMAHPLPFELLLLLFSLWLYARFQKNHAMGFAAASMAVFSVALTQYSTTLLIAPLYGSAMLFSMWRGNCLRFKPILLLVLVFFLGWLPVGLATVRFMTEPLYHWTGLEHGGQVLWQLALDHYVQIRHNVPKLGLLLVLLFSVVPFIFVVLAPKALPSFSILMLASLSLSIILFGNIRIAPWPMFGFRPLLVMPYLIASVWTGCLIAYTIGLIQYFYMTRIRFRRKQKTEATILAVYLVLVFGLIIAAAIANIRSMDIRASSSVARSAHSVAEQLPDDAWLIIDDALESSVRIKAFELGKSPFILSTVRLDKRPYQRALIEDLNDDRLNNLVPLGLMPLLRERMHPSRGESPMMAAVGAPGPLSFVSPSIRPDRLLYTTRWDPDERPEDYLERQRQSWRELGDGLLANRNKPSPHRDLIRHLLVGLSRSANDAGLWLEDQGRPDLAADAFREAARLADKNVPARLNLQRLLDEQSEEFVRLSEEIEALSIPLRGRAQLTDITDTYGEIRHAGSLITDAARWSRVGAPEMARPIIERALAEQDDDQAFSLTAAIIRQQLGDPRPGEDLLAALDHAAVENVSDLIVLVRLAAINNRLDLARRFLELAREKNAPREAIVIEEAHLDLMSGERDAAYRKLTGLDKGALNDPRILAMLAMITAETRPDESARHLERLETFPRLLPQFSLPLARLYLARGNLEASARHLENIVRTRPLDREALQMLLRIRMRQNRVETTRPLIRQLLSIDSRDPHAQYALGLLHYRSGQLDEASVAWRVSLESNPMPEVQNDYAFLLSQLGAYEEALTHADASLAARPSPTVLHTKAVILIGLGRGEDAADAIAQGLAMQPDHPELSALQQRRDATKAQGPGNDSTSSP